jgi:Cdc6-like AAA superfamily ATPase
MGVVTVGVPILVRIAAKKWKIEIDEGEQRLLTDAARRAVRLAEEEARRQIGAGGRLSEVKHMMATDSVRKICSDRECSDEAIDDAVSAAVNELRAETVPPPKGN